MACAGVLTLDGLHNYGNRLQNYAVHQLLSTYDIASYSIRFDRDPLDVRTKQELYCLLRARKKFGAGDEVRRKMFSEFAQLIPYKDFGYAERKQLDRDFDLFVIGSDQVWNPSFTGLSGLYFLPWEEKRKISLAASFGRSSISGTYRKRYAKWLQGISSISVRETEGAKIVSELSSRAASVLLDPVFSLGAEKWSNVANDAVVPAGEYVLAYILGSLALDDMQQLEMTAKRYGLSVIFLSDSDERSSVSAGPSEFISLIQHAKCIVTDSFHASAFSAIFERPLCLMQRKEVGDTSSRFDSLFKTLGMKNLSFIDALEGASQYEGVKGRIRRQNALTNAFLEKALKAE